MPLGTTAHKQERCRAPEPRSASLAGRQRIVILWAEKAARRTTDGESGTGGVAETRREAVEPMARGASACAS
jgi:hypothetical protein